MEDRPEHDTGPSGRPAAAAEQPAPSPGAVQGIGIVAIGRDEGERLARCLASLPSACPVVYVDSGSIDGSRELTIGRGARVVDLDMSLPFSAARARNAGVAALLAGEPTLDLVQFVDGDCILAPQWLDQATAFLLSRADVAVVCGQRREIRPEQSIYNRLCDLEWNTPVGEAEACGGDALVRVAAFDAVGGFRADLIAGEEPELCSRLRTAGWKIWRIDAPMTGHDAAILRFGSWWARARRGGFGYAQVWWTTRRAPLVLYGRNLARAILWGGLLPLAGLGLLLVAPLAALLPAGLYAVQIARIARRSTLPRNLAWAAAAFTMIAKLPECAGAVRFAWRRLVGRPVSVVGYK